MESVRVVTPFEMSAMSACMWWPVSLERTLSWRKSRCWMWLIWSSSTSLRNEVQKMHCEPFENRWSEIETCLKWKMRHCLSFLQSLVNSPIPGSICYGKDWRPSCRSGTGWFSRPESHNYRRAGCPNHSTLFPQREFTTWQIFPERFVITIPEPMRCPRRSDWFSS